MTMLYLPKEKNMKLIVANLSSMTTKKNLKIINGKWKSKIIGGFL